MTEELKTKLSKIESMLKRRNLDALLIQKVTNFAWASCGASSFVNTTDNQGVASLLITPGGRYLITNNIEAPRFKEEERLEEMGWEFKVTPWYHTKDVISNLTKDLRLGADGFYPGAEDVSVQLVHMRVNLLPEEQQRFKEVCAGCAEAMDRSIRQVKPGMTEFEIAALLVGETQRRGILPIVDLIATDERIFAYRHPLPTNKKLEHYAMLVVCGRKYGLVCSVTRLIHFGRLPEEVSRKVDAVAEIDATFLFATRPGRSLGEILLQAQEKYAALGYPGEWKLHHQGGPAGYVPREFVATPDSDFLVEAGQVYAWNPSISGAKSEDTILIQEDGFVNMTEIAGWPEISVDIEGQVIHRPAILEIV